MRFVCGDNDQKRMQDAIIQIATEIDVPIRETLQSKITGWENGITKDEFLMAFEEHGIDQWLLICMFHHWDFEDEIDEIVQLETVVKILSQIKHVPYEEPSAAAKPAKPASSTNKAAPSG